MTEPRKKLTLRLRSPTSFDEAGISAALTQAITRGACIVWTYNRTLMKVSPQVLYWRNGALHCDAIVVERHGTVVTEPRFGSFRLSGLRDVSIAGEPLGLWRAIDVADERYRDGIVLCTTN